MVLKQLFLNCILFVRKLCSHGCCMAIIKHVTYLHFVEKLFKMSKLFYSLL